MNFEEALRLMYDGHICKDASCLDYRIKNDVLEYKSNDKWYKSTTPLLSFFHDQWELIKEKKSLSEKIFAQSNESIPLTINERRRIEAISG